MNIKLLTSAILFLSKALYLILMSYSYSPALKRPSVFPLKAVCIVIPTVCKLKPSAAILSLSTFTLTSGFPSSTDNSISVAPGMVRNSFSAAIANFIALSTSGPVTISPKVASSAVPKIPTGTVFTLAPTNIFSNLRFVFAAYTFAGSSRWSNSTIFTLISDL